MNSIFYSFILLFITSLIFPLFFISYASHKVLYENFDDGDLNGWIVTRNQCLYNGNPAVWRVINGKLVIKTNGGRCFTEIMPDDNLWNGIGDNYIVEFDMTLVTGADHTIAFRYTDPEHWYDFHIQTPGRLILDSSGSVHYGDYSNGQTIHFKLIINGRHVSVYRGINPQILIIDNPHVNANFPTGRIAPQAAPGGGELETHFDNIVVTSIDNEPNLDVPLLKQTSEPWQSMEYDSAHKWSPASPTIYSWGCALTSATMILQYYGIDKTPYGTRLDPGTLNNWLRSQPDGYISNGFVNWLAISRFSRLAKESGNNPNFSFDALEYDRNSGTNKRQQLINDLNDDRPGILEVPGHFVVAKGIEGNTFLINDPFYTRERLSDGYNNDFISVGRYIPTNTDLSYIMVVNDQNLHIKLKDTLGNILSESFSQLPLENETNSEEKSEDPLKILYLKKPSSGIYHMEITSDATQKDIVDLYLYSSLGDVTTSRHQILISKNNPEIITIKFDKDNKDQSQVKRIITFQTVIADINEGISLKELNKNLGNQLKRLISRAEKDIQSNHKISAEMRLETAIWLLKSNKGVLIKQSIFDILMQDFTYLKSSL